MQYLCWLRIYSFFFRSWNKYYYSEEYVDTQSNMIWPLLVVVYTHSSISFCIASELLFVYDINGFVLFFVAKKKYRKIRDVHLNSCAMRVRLSSSSGAMFIWSCFSESLIIKNTNEYKQQFYTAQSTFICCNHCVRNVWLHRLELRWTFNYLCTNSSYWTSSYWNVFLFWLHQVILHALFVVDGSILTVERT